jgi:UDP-N-acetylglucosamine 2-epimerase (non-hydrolysing)/GDP/UDP-N,N'-diacetylbacillosamine 2-epimerase (hydrolysing)
MSRRITVFTGNRAEYGQLVPIIRSIAVTPELQYSLLVSGAHLDNAFGRTVAEIENDGFHVGGLVPIEVSSETTDTTARAISITTAGVATHLAADAPDLFLVSGDRFEAFGALIASTQMGIPTAHIEGGDLTEGGTLDDSVRHAMTKLAHLHLVTNADAAARVKNMGEEPWRIHTVGLPSIDLIAAGEFASNSEVCERLDIDISRPIVVFTQHSIATEADQAEAQFVASLTALRRLAADGYQIVLTYPNTDSGGETILRMIHMLEVEKPPGFIVRPSLGRYLYHGLLRTCADYRGVCAGNSSSGVKETPAFGCPAVNIGARQLNRLRAENVMEVADHDSPAIERAIRRSVDDRDWREHCRHVTNPYGDGTAGRRVADILARVDLNNRLIQKRMTY